MELQTLVVIINNELDLDLPEHSSFAAIRTCIQDAVTKLIDNNLQQLVNILYRVDVNERKLKYLLQENVGEDAAVIIADLIIERQMEKIALRKQYSRPDDTIDEEEKW